MLSQRVIKERLLKWYSRADWTQRNAGLLWYTRASWEVDDLAERYNVSRIVAAGVVAVISPRITWKQNIKLANVLLANAYERGLFKANLRKAMRIMDGEAPSHVLKGSKVNAFYRSILGFDDPVIDAWMLRAVGWRKKCTPKLYTKIATAISELAASLQIKGQQFQAIVWCTMRGSGD